MNINGILTRFAQQDLVLSHNDAARDKIKGSLNHLEKVLADRLGDTIVEFIRFGSFTRNTILPRQYDPNSDVDLMVVFNKANYNYSAGTFRKWLHDVVSDAYPNSLSKKDHPVVKLELYHIMFDIVPAYSTNNWNGKTFYIPDVRDGWRTTVPNDINNDLSQKNQSYGDNIVRNVIRLCKHWNAMAGYPFESYVMEKQIVNSFLWHGDNLYDKFISVLGNLAGRKAGVAQALTWIKKYKGDWFNPANENKQFEWLQRLLPGLQ
jgi:predicted nucleotidyltransferase